MQAFFLQHVLSCHLLHVPIGYDIELSIRPPGFNSESGPLFYEAQSLIRAFIPLGLYIGTSLDEHQGYDWVCIDLNKLHPDYVFAIQHWLNLLQALGWALTEYGDCLQSLVATRLDKQIHSMHILQ